MIKHIISIVFLISPLLVLTQENQLTFSEYLEIVKKHHPVAFQANLKEMEGEVYVQKAKGGFDPKIIGNVSQKYFDGKQYYSYINGGLKIPTWYGIEADVGYNNNSGDRLNPESYNVETGIWNVGVTVNLGKGLFIDQRRADLKQAEIMKNSTVLERKLILNRLIFDASIAYLEWYKAYEKVKLYERNMENIQDRFWNIKQNVLFGDKPHLDTLKVRIQIQDRSLKLTQNKMELVIKKNLLNTFLWQDGMIPLELDTAVAPFVDVSIPDLALNAPLDSLIDNHPEILMQENNISISQIGYRLKKESLKPTLKLKYNALSSDMGAGVINDYAIDNYKWGGSISYPIFTRKERADVKLSKFKVERNQAKLVNKRALVNYKIQSIINQMRSYQEQVEIQEKAVEMYQDLLVAEQRLFDLGESSLFLINTRDQNLIKAQLEMIEVYFNHKISEAGMRYHTLLAF